MLRSIIICPDADLAVRLETSAKATGEVTVARTVNRYPNSIDLIRTLRAHAPEVVFLSFESLEKAQEVVKFLDSEANGIQIIAVHRQVDAKLLRETMRVGVREWLSDTFDRHSVVEALATVTAEA